MPVTRVGWRRGAGDQGSVGVTFAILLSSGVLLGMLAIVVDVGRLYVERDDLQNGADSAALALARACAAPATSPLAVDCGSLIALRSLAQRYADDNAADGTSTVDVNGICGVGEVPGVLPPCGEQPENLTGCLGERPSAQYVEVHLSTRMRDGSTVLPPAFAQTLMGADAGTTVGACARAAWGPRDMSILAMTISTCEFDEQTRLGFGDQDNLRTSDERVIQFWTGSHWTCGPPWPDAPWSSPGPAGFLSGGGSDCQIAMANDGVVGADTGARFVDFYPYKLAPQACEERISAARRDRELIYLPVHDGVGPDDASFRHIGVAPFLVTGFQFGCNPAACGDNPVDPDLGPYDPLDHLERSYLTGNLNPCGTDGPFYRCLTGVFVGPAIPIEQLTGDARIRLDG